MAQLSDKEEKMYQALPRVLKEDVYKGFRGVLAYNYIYRVFLITGHKGDTPAFWFYTGDDAVWASVLSVLFGAGGFPTEWSKGSTGNRYLKLCYLLRVFQAYEAGNFPYGREAVSLRGESTFEGYLGKVYDEWVSKGYIVEEDSTDSTEESEGDREREGLGVLLVKGLEAIKQKSLVSEGNAVYSSEGYMPYSGVFALTSAVRVDSASEVFDMLKGYASLMALTYWAEGGMGKGYNGDNWVKYLLSEAGAAMGCAGELTAEGIAKEVCDGR